jgi:large subunit ribosomal protein L10
MLMKGGKTMTKEQKHEIVAYVSDEFKSSNAVLAYSYKGLTCKELEELRISADEKDVKVQIVKNSLASIASENAGYTKFDLVQPTIFIWGEDQIATCKVASDFAKSKKDLFTYKAAIVEGEVADFNTVNAFANLPSRDELIGMLLSVWTAPARNFVTGLDNLRDKLENGSDNTEDAA